MKSLFTLLILLTSSVLCASLDTIIIDNDTDEESNVCLNPSCGLKSTLSNGGEIPMVGMGAGSMPTDLLNTTITRNLNQHHYRLIDTSRKSNNEFEIAESISNFHGADDEEDVIHVITKVWYTHLGYDRTKISIEESMNNLPGHLNIRLHILIHWPRCYDDIPWMNCELEEKRLVDWIKFAGPPPHENEDAWKESWRALEDTYLAQKTTREKRKDKNNWKKPIIESIGISNFQLEDMKELMAFARVKPSIYQGSLWNTIHNPHLMTFLEDHDIQFQTYGIMHMAIEKKDKCPRAYSILTDLAKTLEDRSISELPVTEAMVIMAWLVQEGIAIIPQSSSPHHQAENSPLSIGSIPPLTTKERDQVKKAMSSLMREQDLHVDAVFQNNSRGTITIYWVDPKTAEEFQVIDALEMGESVTVTTHPTHHFAAYAEKKQSRQEFTISVAYGETEDFDYSESS